MPVTFKAPMPLQEAEEVVKRLKKKFKKLKFVKMEVCGSIRRRAPEVGDIDIVVSGPLLYTLKAEFNWLEGGARKATLEFEGHQINVLQADPERWGAAIFYFTGPHFYNIGYRVRAKKMGLLLNEYGLWDGAGKCLACATEAEIYTALGKPFKAPELRGK